MQLADRLNIRALTLALAVGACLSSHVGNAEASVSCDRVASPVGSDGAAGTEAAPFRTAQQLVGSLAAGQTGCLRAGTYAENVKISRGGQAGAPVTLRSYPAEKATLKGRLWVAKGADHVSVEQLYLDGRNANNLPSPNVNAANVTFRNNDVTNYHTGICFALGASSVGNDPVWGRAVNPVIADNRIHDCGKLPATNQHHGIYVEAADNARIERNWIYDNADRGIQIFPDAQATSVIGNVIDGNGEGIAFGGDGGLASSSNRVENNLITNSNIRANVEAWWAAGNPIGRDNSVSNNCIKGGAKDTTNGGIDTTGGGFTATNNLRLDPLYSDPAADDFRVRATSECVLTSAVNATASPGPDVDTLPALALAPARPITRPLTRLRLTLRLAARASSRIRPGTRLRLSGRGPAGRAGRRVTIRMWYRGGWRTVARARMTRSGRFTLTWRARTPRSARTVRLRASVPGAGVSNVIRLRLAG